jgi:glucosylceramidase
MLLEKAIVLAVAAALTGGVSAAPSGSAALVGVAPSYPTVLAGTTSSADGSVVLAPLSASSFTPVPALDSTPSVLIDPAATAQTMTGFGAALTDSSAWVISQLPADRRDALMRSLFGPGGAGITYLRIPMGASDFALSPYTYDDVPAGSTDPTLSSFSVAHDDAYILPLLREARQLDPSLSIIAAPWSPPAWMKTGGSLDGGTLVAGDQGVYAQYFVRFLQAYAAAGVPVNAVTPQNEPENATTSYPSMSLSAAQESTFVGGYLGPALSAAGLATTIVAYDDSWNDPAYPTTVELDPAVRSYVGGVAFHCYAGDPSEQNVVHLAAPTAAFLVTECSGGNFAPDYASDLSWDADTLMIGSIDAWAGGVLLWNLALDPSSGPVAAGGCSGCRGVVTVGSDGTVTDNVEYTILGQLTRAAPPGSTRVVSTDPALGSLRTVAFRQPDGGLALFAHNDGTTPTTFDVRDGSTAFRTTLPAGGVATYTWRD